MAKSWLASLIYVGVEKIRAVEPTEHSETNRTRRIGDTHGHGLSSWVCFFFHRRLAFYAINDNVKSLGAAAGGAKTACYQNLLCPRDRGRAKV